MLLDSLKKEAILAQAGDFDERTGT